MSVRDETSATPILREINVVEFIFHHFILDFFHELFVLHRILVHYFTSKFRISMYLVFSDADLSLMNNYPLPSNFRIYVLICSQIPNHSFFLSRVVLIQFVFFIFLAPTKTQLRKNILISAVLSVNKFLQI